MVPRLSSPASPLTPAFRRMFVTLLAAGSLSALLASARVEAHLMVIRQGQESADLPQPGDRLGEALAVGDFNNDGYDDLASAAPFENEGIEPNQEHGSIIVNYGTARGLTHVGATYVTVGAVPQSTVHFGAAMAVADFDGDGYDDLAVGLPDVDQNLGNTLDAGEVQIYRGGASGVSTTASQFLRQDMAGGAIEAGDRFGASLAAGDFNGDGRPDLAIGATGEDLSTGAISIFYGSAAGLSVSGAFTMLPSAFVSTNETGSKFGFALAAGDFISSGISDLAIGAPYATVGGQSNAGRVFVARGAPGGLTASGGLDITQTALALPLASNDLLGYSLARGRFLPGAAKDHLAIGEIGYDGALLDVGRVVVVTNFTLPLGAASRKLVSQVTQNIDPEEPVDQFGRAIAAGDYDADGVDDLAIGAPWEDVEKTPVDYINNLNAGQITLFYGGNSFPTSPQCQEWQGRSLSDTVATGDELGWALAFGHFDNSGRANLAAGAPGRDYPDYRYENNNIPDAGQIYVIAPWRQLVKHAHRSSIALDCQGEIVCSQRPFQAVPPASTTKAMTVLIAVEAIQSGEIDSNAVYTVPGWVADTVTGSQQGLFAGDQVRFVDLIKMAISVSAGDACYAIGDTLTGGHHVWNGIEGTIPGFANRMNVRAAELGMNQTHFTNPSGRPMREHFTTAYDFALFAREAMTNPLFRYFASTNEWPIGDTLTKNAWVKGMKKFFPQCDGVKPGANELGLGTGMYHATGDGGERVSASLFGVPDSSFGSPNTDSTSNAGRDLLQLASSICPVGFKPLPPDPPTGPFMTQTGIPTASGTHRCALVELPGQPAGDAFVELYPQSLPAAPASATVRVWRSSETNVRPGQDAVVGFSGGVSHQGITIMNSGAASVQLVLTPSAPSGPITITLAPDAHYLLAAQNPMGSNYTLTIHNVSATAVARLQITENDYTANATVSSGAPFSAALRRDGHMGGEVVRVCVDGQNPVAGNTVYLVLRTRDAVLDVHRDPVSPLAAGVQLGAAWPNPSFGRSSFVFSLPGAARVWVTVHDVAGRRVSRLLDGELRAAGEHRLSWSGLDDRGHRMPPGVYLVRLRTPEGLRSSRVVLLGGAGGDM